MEIHIISREIIKPSSSTPHHLRSYKLSRVDQLFFNISFPIFLVYSGATKNSDHLKTSLSKTLSLYYPFAGRVKDHLSVDCDDYGVDFVEARVAGDMSQILKQPEVNLLEQLMPYKQNELSSTQFSLAVQVSYFDCGGMTICVCFRHVLADAVAAINFIKSWATVACDGGNHLIENVVFDCTSSFPPQDNLESYAQKLHDTSIETVTKRFVFEGSKISALREKIGNRPTRFEALFALMWGSVTGAAKGEKDGHREFVLETSVNLRKRLNPPIPEQCIGNILLIIRGSLPEEEEEEEEETINYKSYVERIRELISLVNEDHVKKASPYGWLLNRVKNDHGIGRNKTMRSFSISSCGRLPFYEVDFGWGKPIWATIVARQVGDNIFVALFDTSDGKGMEGWVVMSKDEMDQFEQDPVVLAYASANPSISSL